MFEICQNLQISFKSKYISVPFFADKLSLHNLKNEILLNQNWQSKRGSKYTFIFFLWLREFRKLYI